MLWVQLAQLRGRLAAAQQRIHGGRHISVDQPPAQGGREAGYGRHASM